MAKRKSEWAGEWKGGRYYFDEERRPVFFIEKMRNGERYSIRLKTHDKDLAIGELAQFLKDPVAFAKRDAEQEEPPPPKPDAVYITDDRINRYLESIADTVADHRAARRSYLLAWSALELDLRTVDRKVLRASLASFEGGHRGRTEALNAFARWLVREEELLAWRPLVNEIESEETRAERIAYTVDQLHAAYKKLADQRMRDVLLLRAETGLHETEVDQITAFDEAAQAYTACKVFTGPLPETGAGIRKLGGKHEIRGVLQVVHKSRQRHRQSLSAAALAAALRLRESGVPPRTTLWKHLGAVGLVPSNLRHTFVTLAGEIGVDVTYSGAGVDRARIAQVIGHRAGSTMTADHYEKVQVPPMIRLPFKWPR